MLQQTQVSRVIEPWRRFMDAFPTPRRCADAPLASVLQLWAGLGYHRRAKALHETAKRIRDDFSGEVPSSVFALRSLPGVGDYTANAVASFAFVERVAVLDTNGGRVLARAIANRTLRTAEARDLAERLLPDEHVAAFNQAMLDLGAQYCKATPSCTSCPVARSCRWKKEGGVDPAPLSAGVSRRQSAFEGSDRQLRGRLLALLRDADVEFRDVTKLLGSNDVSRVGAIVERMVNEGLIERRGTRVQLARS